MYSLLCQPADTHPDIYIRLNIDPILCTLIAHVSGYVISEGGRAGVGLGNVMCHFSVLNVSGRWHVVSALYIGAAVKGRSDRCLVSHKIINVKIDFLGQPIL